ncbi:MAG TPA: UDP-2,3-diacylglucosamine diphosphatase, partial [Planctomycetia bacterium]|nr:UDP-2,3-diacylglucosamine diphosphatase [Planctomycetia bacterium]
MSATLAAPAEFNLLMTPPDVGIDPPTVRTLFLSDLHLGATAARAEACLDFLQERRPATLYLLGDIVDGWALRRRWRWREAYSEIVRLFLSWSAAGTRIVYVPGNHDDFLRGYLGPLAGVEICDEAVHETEDGLLLLVTHGDRYDGREGRRLPVRVLHRIGDVGYDMLQWIDGAAGRMRPDRAISLIERAQQWGPVARFVRRFEERLEVAARRRDFESLFKA